MPNVQELTYTAPAPCFAPPPGIGPGPQLPKSCVLPLHYGGLASRIGKQACYFVILTHVVRFLLLFSRS